MKRESIIATTAVLILGVFTSIFGQTVQNTKNTSDQTLRSNGRVNPSSLGMEMDIPLGAYPGRGINLPLGLSYSSKLWRFKEHSSILQNNDNTHVYVFAKYSEDASSGWSSSLSQPYIEYTGNETLFDDYGRPLAELYGGGQTSPPGDNYVRRITVYLPGGGSHELRADDAPIHITAGQAPPASAWEGDFYATDGSGLKYHQDSNNGIFRLYMPDGSFYTFNATLESKSTQDPIDVRRANRLTDINGNYVQFNAPTTSYPNGSWTDQLGRTFPVMIPRETPAIPTNQSILEQTFILPGMSQGYTLRWKKLKGDTAETSGFTDFNNQVLKYSGHTDLSQPPNSYTPNLFYSAEQMSSCSGNKLFVAVNPAEKFNPVVLTEVVLPTGASYRFSYNEYGEMERIHYPTGGREEISYDKVASLAELGTPYQMSNRGVTSRKIYESSADTTADTWTYTAAKSANNFRTGTIAPDGTQTDRFMHRGVPEPSCNQQTSQGAAENTYGTHWGYDNVLAGMPFEERSFSSDGQLKQRTLTRWTATNTTTILTGSPQRYVQRNARVLSTESIVYEGDAGLSTAVSMEYDTDVDNFGSPQNVIKAKQYDYKVVSGGSAFTPGQAPPTDAVVIPDPTISATLLKTVEYTYLQSDASYNQSAYLANNLVKLVIGKKLRNPNNQIVAQTEIKYDEANYGNGYRGQPTRLRNWLDTNDSWLETRSKYDTYGNLIEITDAKGNVSTTEYSSNYGYAYPTKVTTPVPDPSGTNGSQTAFQTTMTYNATTGLLLTVTDTNGQTSTMEYNDALLRPTRAIAPNGHQTITEYGAGTSESTRFVKVKAQIDASVWKEGYSWFDGLGQTIKTQAVDSQGDIFTETEYDNMGRVKRSTNPYRTGETKQWTTPTYDNFGRATTVTLPDSSTIQTVYGLSTSGTIGVTKQITDQSGKKRQGISDALGRMIRVIEDPTGQNLNTDYVFDLLGNLRKTTQGEQNRYFMHDSLGRLIYAKQPEQSANTAFTATDSITGNTQWSVKYEYDENGNIISTTDARNVIVAGTYDNLNRLTFRNYSDSTPDVNFYYDGKYLDVNDVPQTATGSAKGKTTGIKTSVSKTNYTSFDTMGRLLTHQQITDGQTYSTEYAYNLSGALIEETYPSGRKVRNVLNSDGELSMVQSKKNSNYGYHTYANGFSYDSSGAATKMRLGNGRWETYSYNNRQQITQIGLGTTDAQTDFLKLEYAYNTSGNTDNNGNMREQKITVPTANGSSGFTATQTYTYDSLNRLELATETISSSQTWKQTFQYDRYGNRRFDANNTTTLGSCSQSVCNPLINTSDNRFSANQGYNYDANGNLTGDANSKKFTYNAENHQIKVETVDANGNPISTNGEYLYDGDGKRVKKTSGSETVIFVYNAGGQLVAEYSTQTAQTPQVSYLTADHLGSPRVITDQNGAVTKRQDYLAFGDETVSAQRVSGLGYTTQDNVRQGYTGYEKDDESGLDFAQARYYNSQHGRFTSVDPLTASASIRTPQTFNRYSYVLNSPYKFTDPLGLISVNSIACGQWCANSYQGEGGGGGISGAVASGGTSAAEEGTPVFDWENLTPNEQRIFNNTQLTIPIPDASMCGPNAEPAEITISGETLFNYLANGTQAQQRALASVLNQTAQLESITLTDGSSAISHVESIAGFAEDRVFLNIDEKLKGLVENDKDFYEDNLANHPGYPDSYRYKGHQKGALQLSFSEDGRSVDADTDYDLPNDVVGGLKHLTHTLKNKITKSKTNPYEVHKIFSERKDFRVSYTVQR